MHVWSWLNTNSGALQSLFAMVSALLTAVTICVLIVTWRAIKTQAAEARALTAVAKQQTEVARQQTEAITKQAQAAGESIASLKQSNLLAIQANELALAKMRSDMSPILVFDSLFDREANIQRDAIRNVGSGAARNIQMSLGGNTPDDVTKQFIPSRTVLGASDAVSLGINHALLQKYGMTIHYESLDGRRFTMKVYSQGPAWRHDLMEFPALLERQS